MFDPLSRILLGLATGFLFGFLLQKGQVAKFHVIVGQFLLRDFTVLKTMLTAILVGGVGVYALVAMGQAALHIKPAQMAAVGLGGALFGVAMVVLGYCPGTGVAAAAEGSRHAWFGLLGMAAGAALYAEAAPYLGPLLGWANYGPVTLPQLTGWPAWVIFALLAPAALLVFRWVERREEISRASAAARR